jgi:hypothetical protein
MSLRPKRRCTKDTIFTFLCSCDDCSRAAAGAWHGYMDRVLAGDITLNEAQRMDNAQ